MVEYNQNVAGLQALLKERGLPTSGKKADLIARLQESDKAAETQTTEPDQTAEAEGVDAAVVETPQEQPATEDASAQQVESYTVEDTAPAEETAPAVEAKNFAQGLPASDIDAEMEKRKKRAERFKSNPSANADAEATETATTDGDALKHLERAKRFGEGSTAIGKLDEALPSERERLTRGKKRGAADVDENSALEDPGLKRNFRGKGRFAHRRRGGPGKPTGIAKPGAAAYSSDKDRQAAEARKRRFAAQPAAS